jgi:hypothetical protein
MRIDISDLKSTAISIELIELVRAWDAFRLGSEASALAASVTGLAGLQHQGLESEYIGESKATELRG